MSYDAVVFDMDGVIFDTERIVLKAWQVVADKYNIKDVDKAHLACLGMNQSDACDKFCEIYGEDFPYYEYKKETRELFFGPFYGEHLPIKPGTKELLQYLKNEKKKIALASSTRLEIVEKELSDAGLLHYFDALMCGDMVSKSKPDPEIFVRACQKLQVSVERTYAIEDSYNGIKSAYYGGLIPVMIPDMLEPTDEIKGYVKHIFNSLLEFLEYLRMEK